MFRGKKCWKLFLGLQEIIKRNCIIRAGFLVKRSIFKFTAHLKVRHFLIYITLWQCEGVRNSENIRPMAAAEVTHENRNFMAPPLNGLWCMCVSQVNGNETFIYVYMHSSLPPPLATTTSSSYQVEWLTCTRTYPFLLLTITYFFSNTYVIYVSYG